MSQPNNGPTYDKELVSLHGTVHFNPVTTLDDIHELRRLTRSRLDGILEHRQVKHQTYIILGPGGDLQVSVFRPSILSPSRSGDTPAIIYIHPGGMVAGDRFTGIELMLEHVEQEHVVCITVEYRLAPEHPYPAALEDCYSTLEWARDNAINLGISPSKFILAGMSAGGGLAAGVALLCRDRGGPSIRGQILISPMLDDRNITMSSRQYTDKSPWPRESNVFAWKCLLNGEQGAATLPVYAAPARASDLSLLPATYIECGSADVFRDEDVTYASRLWEYGVQSELHIWPGGWHAFQIYSPESKLAKMATETRSSWLHRQLTDMEADNE
ncbi:alpha/beta hydrolase [Aspergillus clavatus NRRL 1]|uniref:Alpha/beta hydrolase fold protein n=1 Tax=Aspergillus clavatus (strain ATCC 1007 / CBS 513.65 / DSM 816 / NCTC 3887 / NRRL 1 / QM 1276 / 107) TaxID=344612 RepID=A1CSF7_ASPCL|nr:alpha/beta hydrolase fold protein [Aspergillus clavatus NRRL 1]EAW08578.1 alpha/beta hydrolase fold protein [Aspergillus clavatus NRRL 1]